jgi:hypothetical protein
MEQSFDLTPSEISTPLSFREGGRKFRVMHIFRPPQFADWLEYETKLNRSVEIVGSQTRFDQQKAEASEAVWDRIALRVEGYRVPSPNVTASATHAVISPPDAVISPRDAVILSGSEGPAFSELPEAFPDEWKSKVPLVHKMAAVILLAQVSVTASEETETYHFDPDQTEISLDAARGGREYSGLVHTLKRPTVRQQKEFSRVVSTALYVRGSRTEKSLLPSRLREMTRFYDELVVGAHGYSANGAEATREDAIKYMDALHKQTAISALFNFENSGPDPD